MREIIVELFGDIDIDYDLPFGESGFDSMALLSIHQALETNLKIRIPTTDLYDYPTFNELAGYLDERMC